MKKEFESYLIVIDGKNYRLNQIRELEDLGKKEAIFKKRETTRTMNLPPDTIQLKERSSKPPKISILEEIRKMNNIRKLLETYQKSIQNLYNKGASIDEIQRVYQEFESEFNVLKLGISQRDIDRECERYKITINNSVPIKLNEWKYEKMQLMHRFEELYGNNKSSEYQKDKEKHKIIDDLMNEALDYIIKNEDQDVLLEYIDLQFSIQKQKDRYIPINILKKIVEKSISSSEKNILSMYMEFFVTHYSKRFEDFFKREDINNEMLTQIENIFIEFIENKEKEISSLNFTEKFNARKSLRYISCKILNSYLNKVVNGNAEYEVKINNLTGFKALYYATKFKERKEFKYGRLRDGKLYKILELWDLIKKEIENDLGVYKKYSPEIINYIGKIYYEGIKDDLGETILKEDKNFAFKIFNEISKCNIKNKQEKAYTLSRLEDFYSDNTGPYFDENKLKQIERKMKNENLKRVEIVDNMNSINNNEEERRVFVCSDLHGSWATYQAILNSLKEKDKLIILGDVIDRGADGIKILQDIIKKQEKIQLLLGNHELSLLLCRSGVKGKKFDNGFKIREKERWISNNNGGKITCENFDKLTEDEKKKIITFLYNSNLYYKLRIGEDRFTLVHACPAKEKSKGNETFKNLFEGGREDELYQCLTKRKGKDNEYIDFLDGDRITILGHTPTISTDIETQCNGKLFYIDCGAGDVMNAGLLCLNSGDYKLIDVAEEERKLDPNIRI